MDIELNKSNVRRVFEEGFGTGRIEVVDECIAPDAVDWHDFEATAPDMRSHLKGVIQMVRAAVPDLQVTVDDLIGEDTRVAARVTMRGTTVRGDAVDVEQFHIVHCNDAGLGARHWAAIGELPAALGMPA